MTYQLSRYPRRACAALLDLLLLGALLVEGWLLIAEISGLSVTSSQITGSTLAWEAAVGGGVLLVGILGLAWALLSTRLHGATPGKAALGLRVVGEDGGVLTVRDTFLREIAVKLVLLGGLSVASFGLVWAVDALLPLWDREHRAGHDRLMRTRVVDAREARTSPRP